MATRNPRAAAAPQPAANRGAAVLAGKQKATGAGVTRPGARRNPLGDIGNVVGAVVVDGKVKLPEGINRPITRSFGAQLLKQANAAVANKDAIGPAQPAAAPRAAAPKPATTKAPPAKAAAALRPEPQATKDGACSGENIKAPEGARNRKKAVTTLTSVLSARSKVAAGLSDKPKQLIEDIDKTDCDNELAVVEYVEDIYKFYMAAQHESRPGDYMSRQLEVNAKMRAILTDWIVEVHYKLELMPETLYLVMYVVDRYLSMELVRRRDFQLVGIAAMLIASKYEEVWAPPVDDFIGLCDNAYTREEILVTEKAILNKIEWNLTVPTQYVFLQRFAKAAGSGDKELEHMIFFFAELALMEYRMVTFCPSMVAASAVYAARFTLRKTPLWTPTLKHHTGFDEQQLAECASILVSSHAAAPEGKLKAIYKKYASDQFGNVSLHSPAAVLGIA
ncbi:hypothetical protein ACP70R_040387 [Stipagrostis hirtigluma subsp. patula]